MKRILVSFVVITSFWACSSSKTTLSYAESTISDNSKLSAILWQQTSAEYDALCYQAFNVAINRLKAFPADQMGASDKRMAIIVDLDETILNNSPFNGWLIHNNKSYSEANWLEWTSLMKAEFIPGAVEFLEEAKSKGFTLLFISNRTEEELEYTVNNLEMSGVSINRSDVLLKSTSSSKIDRREKVLNNYEVYMLIGDNLADFNDQFDQDLNIALRKEYTEKFKEDFGNKFIVLPNVMYGNWEKALKKDNSDYIQNREAEGLKKYIKGF